MDGSTKAKFVFMSIVLTMMSMSVLGQEHTADYWLTQGDRYYKNEAYNVALDCYNKSLELYPKNAVAWNDRGNALYSLGKLNEAIQAYDKSLELDSKNAVVWSNKGKVLDAQGKYNESIDIYDRSIKLDPINSNAWLNKGVTLNHLGKYNDSITAFDRVIEIDPELTSPWYEKAMVFRILGKYSEAIKAYDRIIDLDPEPSRPWDYKGDVFKIQGKYDDSIRAYDKAIELDPTWETPWNDKGHLLSSLGEYNKSIEAYDRAIELDPESANNWVNKGDVLIDQGKYDEAIKAYDEAIRLDPDYAYALMALGYQGKYDESIQAFNNVDKTKTANFVKSVSREHSDPGAVNSKIEKAPVNITTNNWIMQAVKSADHLSTYRLNSSVTQTLELNGGGANAAPENVTKVTESATTIASVNLSSFQAQANGSTKSLVVQPGFPANSSTTLAVVYQIGNSTYMMDEGGNWTHLLDPKSANEIWGQGNNNQVKAIAESFNQSKADETGSETINGEDAYKLNIVTGSGDYDILYNTAIGIAAKLTQYPVYMPSVNRTELNEMGKIEKTIWISKNSYLPLKYQSQTTFRMTLAVIGGLNSSTGQMEMFKQSMKLPPVLVSIKTIDLYYDFNKPVKVIPPAGALTAPVVRPTQTQVAQQA